MGTINTNPSTTQAKPQRATKRKRVLVTSFGAFLVFVLAFSIFFYLNFQTVEVSGDSMEPTFNSGQRVIVSKAYWLVGNIKKDDIVVINHPNVGTVIKRVYAVGGETVDLYNVPETFKLIQGEYRVPADHYYLLGDNRPVSEDSRAFGAIPKNEVLGKVVIVSFGLGNKAEAKSQ